VDPIDYVRALRRWWFVIVALTLVGFVAAFVTSSGSSTSYQATHILVQNSTNPDAVSLARAAFLTTSGEVPRAAAEALGEDPRAFRADVSVTTDATLNGLQITATDASPQRAVAIADAFANALTASLDQQADTAKSALLEKQRAAITALQTQLAGVPPDSAQAADLLSQIRTAQSDLADLESTVSATSGFTTLQPAAAARASSGTSRAARLAVGTIMGFLLGLVVALVLARFDTRIRSKEAAEAAFGAPVLAEVPQLRRRQRDEGTIIAVADPESLSAESYRGLRTALVVTSRVEAMAADGANRRRRKGTLPGSPGAPAPPTAATRVVLVASPGMGDGKTTTAANLAVAFAESGQSVLVLGCDLRRPELHTYFGGEPGPGLTEELAKPAGQASLTNIIRETGIPGVRFAPSGKPVEHPGELLARGLTLIQSARRFADVVIIDTAPLLATDDASVLLPLVDNVVIVCRAGRTSNEAATRARELLQRLVAPVAGVVLIGAAQLPSARSYYRLDYRSRPRVKRKTAAPEPEAASPDGSAAPASHASAPVAEAATSSAPQEFTPSNDHVVYKADAEATEESVET
jgi:capsular exopolysaccharide synthesis family protein